MPDAPTPPLTDAEAAARFARDGANELSSAKRRTTTARAWGVVREPMTLLLIACGGIYLLLGDAQESLMLLAFVMLMVAITLFQEQKSERALDALRDLTSPRALVVRSGRRLRIPGREVVPGDHVVLAEGDRVPADVTILECTHLAVDESLLTGEAAAVRKSTWDGKLAPTRPGGQDLPFAYAGTMVVSGSALARAHATGERTEIGRIGGALREERGHETTLGRETRRLVGRLAWIGGGLSLVAAAAHGISRGSALEGAMAGITLAMAVLPNEFPVVVSIFLALGAWRMSKLRILTRRVAAIEAVGGATVLCVDKTGTLTENTMVVRQLLVGGAVYDVERLAREPLPEAFHEAVEFAILASRKDPFDPMERAFKILGEQYLAGTEHLHEDWTLLEEYPLSRELLAVTQVWRAQDDGRAVVAMKGAPEAVADLCHLDADAMDRLARDVDQLARDGLRVLAVARGVSNGALPSRAHDFDFELLGFVGLEDPVRKDVPKAIADCSAAHIRVVMMTGDHPATALSVARQIGLSGTGSVVTGAELSTMSAAELRARARTTSVYARVLPEQKLQIVDALRASGEVVAMTGDGVNDAPALRAADIGVAMGARGTDVAREASMLVLLDDDFASLVQAVRSGRRIMDNLQKALAYILAVHLPIIGLTLAPIFLRWPLVLLPVHIAFLHLVIDPACSVVFEAEGEEADVMRRPPRSPGAPLFGARLIGLSMAQGGAVMAAVVGVYAVALHSGRGELEARALTFTSFVVANLGLIFTNRHWARGAAGSVQASPNRALRWLTAITPTLLAVVIYTPGLRTLFRFAPLRALDVGLCLGTGILSVAWFELLKVVWWRDTTRVPLPASGES